MLYKLMDIKLKKAEEETSSIEAVFSTEDKDRHGDVVKQAWDLKAFKKNPVIVNSHNYFDASEVIGKASKIAVKDGKLEGKIDFAVEQNPKAKIIYDLYAGGFLNAFSVGFIPKDFSPKGEILNSELLEISAVSVPANAMALAKAKGIDVDLLNDQYEKSKKRRRSEPEVIGELTEEPDKGEEPIEIDEEPEEIKGGDDEEIREGGIEAEENNEESNNEGIEADEETIDEELEEGEEEEIDDEIGDEEVVLNPEIEAEVEELDEEENKKQLLVKINKAINNLHESIKVETRETVNSEEIRLINKAVRKLLEIKK